MTPRCRSFDQITLPVAFFAAGSSVFVQSIWTTRPGLRLAAASGLPSVALDVIAQLPLGTASGPCGAAASLGRQVVVSDVLDDPLCAELKPVLLASLAVTVFMAAMTLWMSPLSLRLWRELRSEVNGNLLTSILREGEFVKIENGLFFQLRQRMPDGTLRGIFLSDSREDEESVDYIAERGAVLDSPLGIFLVMSDGT